MNLKSSVLIFDSIYADPNIFGADIVPSLELYSEAIRIQKYSTLVINLKNVSDFQLEKCLSDALMSNPNAQLILFESQQFTSTLIPFINRFKVFKILSDRDEDSLFKSIVGAKSEYDLITQNAQLLDLIQEKNLKLRDLNIDLELRIEARQKSLEESRKNLLLANKYYSALLQSLVGIQKAQTITDIEKSVFAALTEPLRIRLVKIQFQNATSPLDHNAKHIFKNKLSLDEPFEAHILYSKKPEEVFSKEEQVFLKQISSAVSLALRKLHSEQATQDLKQQWQITFDAIQEPVMLIKENAEVIQWNKAYEQKLYKKNEAELDFSLTRQHIDTLENQKIFLNIYRDLSEQRRVERQILESSKMGELGLIGGSIAHELNNPLAGLITFIQMLKMDAKQDSTILPDIEAMDAAAMRCKDIIQNLLSFTRKSTEQNEKIFVRDIINKALRILQVKTKPMGLAIVTTFKSDQDQILGKANPLTQAIVNVIQNSIESIEEKRKTESFNPAIEIVVSQEGEFVFVDIYDNGLGLTPDQQLKAFTPFFTTKNPDIHRGLGLTIAYQIMSEHSGNIDISQVSQEKTRVRIYFTV